MSRSKKVVLIVCIILAILVLAVMVYYLWPWNKAFFDNAKKEFLIPGLDSSFVPQGFSKIDDDSYIISGYMGNGEASRFYITNGEDVKYFTLKLEDSDYVGHAGGVVCHADAIWVADCKKEGYCYRFSLADALNAENGGKVNIIDGFATNNGADCVWVSDNLLWVGEFYKAGNYETNEKHHIKTSSGEVNTAVAYGYEINVNNPAGVQSNVPVKALSMIGLCQGVDVTSSGKFVVSTSYSIPDSNIYYYKNVLAEDKHDEIVVNGNTVPLWYLDNNALISKTNAPSMSEEVVVKGDRVYILFESNCQKYRLVNRVKVSNVYSLDLNFLEQN